jgi:hypothetical protein
MNPTTQQLRALGYDVAVGKAVPAAAEKPRAKRFIDSMGNPLHRLPVTRKRRTDPAAYRSWLTEQQHGPGVFLPLRCLNESNRRGRGDDRWAKAKRAKEQRNAANIAMRCARHPGYMVTRRDLPAAITLTRYGPRRMDDDGNQRALKAVRDGVADAFGTNDGPDGGLTFEYRQEVANFYGCRIEVAARKDGTT